jgi:nucleotide-binding universal stress UspA family protein
MTTSALAERVVVAVDGSPAAQRALAWAAAEAARLQRPLHVLHAQVVDTIYTGDGVFTALSAEETERVLEPARKLLDEATATARDLAPGVVVTSELSTHPPARAVVEASPQAHLIVLGARGHGAVAAVLLGSVSTQVTRQRPARWSS